MVILGIENGILTPIYPNQFLISLKLEVKMELGIQHLYVVHGVMTARQFVALQVRV